MRRADSVFALCHAPSCVHHVSIPRSHVLCSCHQMQTQLTAAAVCRSWHALVHQLFSSEPWTRYPQSIVLPQQLATLVGSVILAHVLLTLPSFVKTMAVVFLHLHLKSSGGYFCDLVAAIYTCSLSHVTLAVCRDVSLLWLANRGETYSNLCRFKW